MNRATIVETTTTEVGATITTPSSVRCEAATTGIANNVARVVFAIMLLVVLAPLVTLAQPEKAHATPSALNVSWTDLKPKLDAGLGVPYVFGGATPIGWDCSGYAAYTFNHHFGTSYIHYTTSFESQLRAQGCYVTTLTASNLRDAAVKPGDVLFLYTDGVSEPTHMGIAGDRVDGCIVVYHAFTNTMSAEGYAGTFRQGLDADVTGAGNTLWNSHSGHGKGSWSHITVYRGVQSTGGISLVKQSANASVTDGNDCYDLGGAVYGIFTSEADVSAVDFTTRAWFTQTTGQINSDGTQADDRWATGMDIPAGNYWVREITSPQGYALDTTVYPVVVEPGMSTRVGGGTEAVFDAPQHNPLGVVLSKTDLETAASTPQGSASLAGTLFTMRYYDGFYGTVAEAVASGEPTRTWVMATDEQGQVRLDDDCWVSGDALYHEANGSATLPLGTVLIQETAAPAGYLLDETIHVRQVTSDGTNERVDTYLTLTQPEQIMRGGVSIEKRDKESGLFTPLGTASIDGALFEITTTSVNPVMVEGTSFAAGQVVATLEIHEGVAATAPDALPYGTYEIREVSAGDGYLLTDGEARAFAITTEGHIMRFVDDDAWFNQVKRGDLELVKVREDNMSRLVGVPFLLTSKTTGERHVVVTDANGQLNTSSDWNRHTQKTNTNDTAVTETAEEYTLDESKLDSEAGTWFGITAEDNMVDANDELGALPFDTYTLEELRCSTNRDCNLVKLDSIVITRDHTTISLGTIDDSTASTPNLSTSAVDGLDGDKVVLGNGDVVVIDHVKYQNLESDQSYLLRGELRDKTTGDAVVIDGTPVTSELMFLAESANDSVEMRFEFDGLSYTGEEIVVFETLYSADGSTVVARHEDLQDTQQLVRVAAPFIQTTALDGLNGDKTVIADVNAVVVDTVAYHNLIPNAEYELAGSVMVKYTTEDGTVEAAPLLNDGQPVTTSTAFTPTSSSGTIDMTFSFDCTSAPLDDDTELVVFEILTHQGRQVCVHADPTDEGQTVTLAVQPPVQAMTTVQTGDGAAAPLVSVALLALAALVLAAVRKQSIR